MKIVNSDQLWPLHFASKSSQIAFLKFLKPKLSSTFETVYFHTPLDCVGEKICTRPCSFISSTFQMETASLENLQQEQNKFQKVATKGLQIDIEHWD